MNTATGADSAWRTVLVAMSSEQVLYLISFIILGVFLLQVMLLVVIGMQARQIRRFRRRYEAGLARLGNGSDGDGIQRWLAQQQLLEEDVHGLRQELAQAKQALAMLERVQKEQVGRVGIVRYNAFRETGHDLSFSIAWLNQRQDGVVVTSIYARGESNVYAKPVIGGQSPYPLSEEERMAIQKAMEDFQARESHKKSTADAPLTRAR